MYGIVAAIGLPIGVVALNLGIAQYDYARIHDSARHVAFAEAAQAVQRVLNWRDCLANPPPFPSQCIGISQYGQALSPPSRA